MPLLKMASNITGYDCNFVDQPTDDLICLICTFVAKDPQQVTCCGKIYCRACLTEYKKRSNACPQCRKDRISYPDQRSKRHINSLKVKCENIENGCKWIGELSSYKQHIQSCGYSLVACPLNCSVNMLKKDIHLHLCPNRIVSCKLCKEKGKASVISTTHLTTCPKVKIYCTNESCDAKIPRCELFEHRSLCPYEKKRCKYSTIGCTTVINRKDLVSHEKDIQSHFEIALDMVSHLKAVVSTLDSKLRTWRDTEVSKFTFKLENFSKLKQNSEKCFTPSFYSHLGGYRVSSTIYANGEGSYKGQSISVYMLFHRGANDSEVSWPFTGKYTIELLNQLEDNKHHTYELSYPAAKNDESNNRVKYGKDRSETGYGLNNFIPHSELGYRPVLNCQYLKDDCLYFRFAVHPPVQPKPWLVCSQ